MVCPHTLRLKGRLRAKSRAMFAALRGLKRSETKEVEDRRH